MYLVYEHVIFVQPGQNLNRASWFAGDENCICLGQYKSHFGLNAAKALWDKSLKPNINKNDRKTTTTTTIAKKKKSLILYLLFFGKE